MKLFITNLCIFAALIASVYSGTCKSCLAKNNNVCEQVEVKECPTDRCMTVSEHCDIDGSVNPTLYWECANEEFCNKLFSVTNKNGVSLLVNSVCCTGDMCNTPYNVPGDAGALNNHYCKSCLTVAADSECDTEDKVQCRGNQDQCLNFLGTVQRADGSKLTYAIRGCINKDACTYQFSALPGTQPIEIQTFDCSDPDTKTP